MPSLFINVPILNETYSSQHFIFPSRFNMTITFQTPLLDPPFKLPCLFLLICIISIDFINLAKQSLSLVTSLFLSYTFSYTTDFYLLESYPWFAVLKTFMNIILFTKMLDQRSIFHNRKRVIFNQLSFNPCCSIFLLLDL